MKILRIQSCLRPKIKIYVELQCIAIESAQTDVITLWKMANVFASIYTSYFHIKAKKQKQIEKKCENTKTNERTKKSKTKYRRFGEFNNKRTLKTKHILCHKFRQCIHLKMKTQKKGRLDAKRKNRNIIN